MKAIPWKVTDRTSKLPALTGVLDRDVEGSLGDADCLGGHDRAGTVQPPERGAETSARFPQHPVRRDPHPAENDLTRRRTARTHLSLEGSETEHGVAGLYDERADPRPK